MNSNMIVDDLGRVITLTNNNETERLRGIECIKSNISIVNNISEFINSSLGPVGSDKILQDSNDGLIITNDGATILKNMDLSHPIAKLVLQLSEAMDDEIGDGTTSVVVFASALLNRSLELLEKGMHPIKISEGYEKACNTVIEHLQHISEPFDSVDKEVLLNAARTSLNSKIVSNCLDHFSNICVDAVQQVIEKDRKDLDFDLIRIESRIGNDIGKTQLINGVIINKEFSHVQMEKEIKDARIAILTCPFEPPKIKTKHTLNIGSVDDYIKLAQYEQDKFIGMINKLKEVGANCVICQWGFDDEANCLLMENNIPAIRWVGGHEIEQIAVHTKGQIISRFEDLKEEDLGRATVKEISIGTESEKVILIENEKIAKTVTIYVRGGTEMIIEEAKRSIRDAICAVRNIIFNENIIYGGGSAEISASLALQEKAQNSTSAEENVCFIAFAKALEEIPFFLAKNAGLNAINSLSEIRARQILENNCFIGVNSEEENGACMKDKKVFDSLNSKIKQFIMANQLVNMILKIDDIIQTTERE